MSFQKVLDLINLCSEVRNTLDSLMYKCITVFLTKTAILKVQFLKFSSIFLGFSYNLPSTNCQCIIHCAFSWDVLFILRMMWVFLWTAEFGAKCRGWDWFIYGFIPSSYYQVKHQCQKS